MKKMPSSYHSADLPPIKLYRDDLDEIISRLSKVCKDIELSDDIHEFESLDDIKTNMGPHIKKLTIRGKTPNIKIVVGRGAMGDDVALSTSDSANEAVLLFHELKRFLQMKLKWVSKINFNFLWFFVMGSFFIMPLTSTLRSYAQNNIYIVPFLLVFLQITVIYLGLYLYKWKVGSSIYLDYKHTFAFWYANRDKVVVGLIMAILGILGTLLTQYIIRKLF